MQCAIHTQDGQPATSRAARNGAPMTRVLIYAIAIAWGVFLLIGCTRARVVDREAWRRVPANCHMEYDVQGRGVASYCAVP
jgi:hypothetical protein